MVLHCHIDDPSGGLGNTSRESRFGDRRAYRVYAHCLHIPVCQAVSYILHKMASLASLNPFADLSDGDSNKRTGNNKSLPQQRRNNAPNGTRRINQMNIEDDTFGGMSTQHVHIDQLSDFDPLAEPKKAKAVKHEDFTLDSVPARYSNSQPTGENRYETRDSSLGKSHSCEDDLQKLSMLAHRGTLNEAEKMVARELVMERTPGISFAISSAICKNKRELMKLIAQHQGGAFDGQTNHIASANDKLDIFNGADVVQSTFGVNGHGFDKTVEATTTGSFGELEQNSWTEKSKKNAVTDDWFKNSSDEVNVERNFDHSNCVQSPSHNIKRIDPQSLSKRHIDYEHFKITNSGAMVGMIMQRVTSKKILKKWSPRYFVLTSSALSLYKEVWEYTKGMPPKIKVPLHRLMLISDVYVFTKEDTLQGPRRAYQFKVLENKLAAHYSTMHYQQFSRQLPSVEVCKLGHVDEKAARVLRTELVKMVLEKQNNAGASVGRQVVSGRYD